MENNLLIGVIESEEEMDEKSIDCLSMRTNKIGGYPVLSSQSKAETIRNFSSFVCHLCRNPLTFVLQIYCPIDDSLTDRLIHIFVCIHKDCNQSKANEWFAFRSVTPFVQKSEQNVVKSDANSVWIEGQTDWDNEDVEQELDYKNTIVTHMTDLSVSSTQSGGRCETIIIESLAYFRSFYVSVIDEPKGTEWERDVKHIKELMESYESYNQNPSEEKSHKNGNEMYEQNCLNNVYKNDRQNYQFFKRLSLCPKQVIRYQWLGKPLLNSDLQKPVISECTSCGAERVFELQLMPALITYLKPLSDTEIDIDFGTVLIYTCSQNCVQNESFTAEECIVLSDPDNQYIERMEKIKI